MQKKHLLILILVLLIFVDFSFGQCAMCKANLESNIEEEVSFGKTINTGILMLMIAPYIILLLLFRKKIRGIFNNLIKG
jgi:phosphatidylglycerophosphate synthase